MKIFKRCFFVTIILFAIANLLNFTFAQNKPAAPKLEPQVQQIAGMNAELLSGGENEKQLAHSLKWRLNQWDDKQRKEWNETVKHAWQHFYDTNEGLRESIESHKKGFSKILQERLVD